MMKMIFGNIKTLKYAALLCVLLLPAAASGQSPRLDRNEWSNPHTASVGAEVRRTEFVSYDRREDATKNDLKSSPFYMPLKMGEAFAGENPAIDTTVEIPFGWLDRQVFLHVDGLAAYYIKINGRTVGYGEDSRMPTEFNVSQWITDGENNFSIESMPDATGTKLENVTAERATPNIYIYSQPMVRIEDFAIATQIDSLDAQTYILNVSVAISNSYNSTEELRVGYDIYSPTGQLIHYDMQPMEIGGNSRDTIVFTQPLYGVSKTAWSAENPALYSFMLNIRYDNRMTEYIPYKIGLGTTEIRDNTILRNRKPVEIKAAKYNCTADRAASDKELSALKKAGYNTVCPDYPQPAWFYDICEARGLYVIEQANINSAYRTRDRNVGGAYSNDPAWLGTFAERTQSIWRRNRNRPCIIGWSLGGEVGNGYNMYKSYLLLKGLDEHRAVIFNDAQGEWNTDMEPIPMADGAAIAGRKPAVLTGGGQ